MFDLCKLLCNGGTPLKETPNEVQNPASEASDVERVLERQSCPLRRKKK